MGDEPVTEWPRTRRTSATSAGSWLTDELEKRGVVAEMSAPVSTVLVAAVGTRLADAERAVAAFQEVLALPQRPTVDTAHTMLAGETGAFIGSSAQAVMTPRCVECGLVAHACSNRPQTNARSLTGRGRCM